MGWADASVIQAILERSSTFCKARKDYLSCATKGREAQLSSVVKVIPAHARPGGLTPTDISPGRQVHTRLRGEECIPVL